MKDQKKPILTSTDIINGFFKCGLLAYKAESEAPANVVGDGESNVNVKTHTKDSTLFRRKKNEDDVDDEVED